MCVTLCLYKWSMCFFSIVQIVVQAGKNKKNTILVILNLIRLEDSDGEEKQQSHFLWLHCPNFNALHFFLQGVSSIMGYIKSLHAAFES